MKTIYQTRRGTLPGFYFFRKTFKFMAMIMIGLFLGFVISVQSAVALKENQIAPGFSLSTLNGSNFNLSDQRGHYILLNFWATWCGPCKIEMPSLNYLHEKFKGKSLKVIGISNDMFGTRVVEPYVKANKITFPILLDPQMDISKDYGITSLPTTFLIDPKGIIVGILHGAENWAAPDTIMYFEELLSQKK